MYIPPICSQNTLYTKLSILVRNDHYYKMTSINGLHICELADSARTVTQVSNEYNVVKMREAGLACLQCHSQCAGVSDMKVGEAGLLSLSVSDRGKCGLFSICGSSLKSINCFTKRRPAASITLYPHHYTT